MKHSLLFFSLLVVFGLPIANASSFNLAFPTIEQRTIIFDGNYFAESSGSFNLANIQPGYHSLQIYQRRFNRRGQMQQLLVYQGQVFIPQRSNVFARIDHYNRLVTRVQADRRYHRVPPPAPLHYRDQFGMSHHGFDNLVRTMNRTSFDDTKLQIAMQAIRSNGISSAQVLSLMQTLNFESSRLTLAREAYPFVADPQAYYLVNNGFTFSSSSAELSQYISRH